MTLPEQLCEQLTVILFDCFRGSGHDHADFKTAASLQSFEANLYQCGRRFTIPTTGRLRSSPRRIAATMCMSSCGMLYTDGIRLKEITCPCGLGYWDIF